MILRRTQPEQDLVAATLLPLFLAFPPPPSTNTNTNTSTTNPPPNPDRLRKLIDTGGQDHVQPLRKLGVDLRHGRGITCDKDPLEAIDPLARRAPLDTAAVLDHLGGNELVLYLARLRERLGIDSDVPEKY